VVALDDVMEGVAWGCEVVAEAEDTGAAPPPLLPSPPLVWLGPVVDCEDPGSETVQVSCSQMLGSRKMINIDQG